MVVNLDPSYHLSMPFEFYKKSGAHYELQLTLLPRNFRGNGHKAQFLPKEGLDFFILCEQESSNLQIIS